jgi:hypothetical protein
MIKESNEILKELKKVDEKSSVSRIVDEVRKQISDLRNILESADIENHDNIESQIDGIESEINDYEKTNDLVGLESCGDKLQQFFMLLLSQTIEFWILNFDMLSKQANMSSDIVKFNDLRKQGMNAVNNDDINVLMQICHEMWELLPHQAGETFDSSLSGVTK